MKEKLSRCILLFLTVILTANLFTNITSSLVLSFLIIASQLFCLHKEDSAIVFILLASVFGAFYAQEGVRFIGSVLTWGSAAFLLKDLVSYRNCWLSNFKPLLFFLIVVFFSIITTVGGSYSASKFTAMLMNAVIFTIAFSHLMLFPNKHSLGHIGVMYVLYSIFLLGYMNELMGVKISTNSLLYSFAAFRYDINEYLAGDKEIFHINYQDIGMHGCIGLILVLFSEGRNAKRFRTIVVVLSGLIVWYAAARQAILLFAVIWLTYFALYKGLSFKNISLILLLIIGAYILSLNLDAQSLDFLMGSTEGKESARHRIVQTAMSQFYANPLTGVGFGRFYIDGEYGCNEHNLFVELLTEMGIVGFLVFICSSVSLLFKSYHHIKENTHYFTPFLLILLSYLLRSMVSSDLRETIVILILVICIKMTCKNQKSRYENCVYLS